MTPVDLTWSAVALALASPSLVALGRSLAGRSEARRSGVRAARVMVVRPCAGAEVHLERTLASVPRGELCEVVFCVASDDDGAMPAVQHARSQLAERGLASRACVTGARGPNRKVQQIAVALRDVAPEPACVVVVADSDVDLEGHPLDELVAPVSDDAQVGAAWAPPIEVAAEGGLGDVASRAVLGASLHAFPLLAQIDHEGLVGKLFAMRLATIERIGGMASLEEHLGEDMEIARRLGERGLAVVRASSPARSLATGRSLGMTVLRFARWLSVIRAQRPGLLITYPLFFFGAIPFAVVALAFGSSGGALAALVVVASRGLVALAADRLTDGRRSVARLVCDSIVADLVIAAAWVRALATRTFAWRGHVLVIGPGGKLVQRGAEV